LFYSQIIDRYNFLKKALSNRQEAYIVGGAVRDILLNKIPDDIDIAVSEDPYKYGKRLAEKINGSLVKLGKNENIIIKVISKTGIFDISPIRKGSIKKDLSLRDFTINAIAFKINNNSIIDPFLGADDIRKKKIKAVSEDIFKKDPLRLIRTYRFAAFYNFLICENTVNLISKYKNLIIESAGERIKKELFKILDTTQSYYYIMQMADSGLLFSILPELIPLIPINIENTFMFQNSKLYPDIFAHTMRAYNCLEAILNNSFPKLISNIIDISFQIRKKNIPLLKLAILLHDIGKPGVKKIKMNSVNFKGHDEKGAVLAKKICKRLKTSSKEMNYISFIIENHLEALHLFQKNWIASIIKEAEIKFFIKCADKTPDLLVHTISDILGKNEVLSKRDADFVKFGIKLYENFKNDFLSIKSFPPLITGNDLIRIFSLKPSPLFTYILTSVEEARLSRKISNKEDATRLVEKIIADCLYLNKKSNLGLID